jgi:hypothetical protein
MLVIHMAQLYSIIPADSVDADQLALGRAFYTDVEFASQLCREFAAAERCNLELSSCFSKANDTLHIILQHNAHLKELPSKRQPAWPPHQTLIRFDMNLQRLTRHYLFTKRWTPRFFVLRGHHMYYSSGKRGHPNSLEGSLAFMRSNPAPDGHYCLDLRGARARCAFTLIYASFRSNFLAGCSVGACSAVVDGEAFAFEIKFPAGLKVRDADDLLHQLYFIYLFYFIPALPSFPALFCMRAHFQYN